MDWYEPAQWWQGFVICAVCDHRHVAVCPISRDEDEPANGMECPRCASMSCVVEHALDDGDD